MSRRLVRWGRANPSYTGQMCVTPSPLSTTTPTQRSVVATDRAAANIKGAAADMKRAATNDDFTCEEPLGIESEHRLDRHVGPVKPVVFEHHLHNIRSV